MSDELFMFTHPREGATVSGLYEDGPDGREVCVRDAYKSPDNPKGLVSVRQAIREHPDAYFQLNVPVAALWGPPCEPEECDWWKDEAKWRAYCDAVRDSLESFINRTLEKFSGMVRAGCQFVFSEARAKVTKCEPVPDHVFEEVGRRMADLFGRGLKKSPKARKRRPRRS